MLDTNIIVVEGRRDGGDPSERRGRGIYAGCFADVGAARAYGRIKYRLKEKGRPIPENDMWIAASAKYHGLVLVTRDNHFQEIDELQTTSWAG